MRQLATIQKVKEVLPIEGKDKIGLATFENVGWRVIVQKENTKPGDLVVYVEYDSVIPEGKPEFDFLRSRCYRQSVAGFKIGAMKMGGVVSEGIVFPLSSVENILSKPIDQYKEGDEVTKDFGIQLYDDLLQAQQGAPEFTQRKPSWLQRLCFKYCRPLALKIWGDKHKSRHFPTELIGKTDETRVQALSKTLFERNSDVDIVVTEKLDGCSSTYLISPKNDFVMASRNLALDNLKIKHALSTYNKNKLGTFGPRKFWERIACKYEIPQILKDYKAKTGINIAIQGEICGPAIQNNKLKLEDLELFLFNLYDIDKRTYLSYEDMKTFATSYGLKVVPLLDERKLNFKDIEEITEYAKGNSVLNKETIREGVVIRAKDLTMTPETSMGRMFSFKVINPDFLVSNND